MLKITDYGPVTRFDMARSLPGGFRYWTTCYMVDGMLVDTGCAHCRPEMLKVLEGRPLDRIVNTHTHEDHIGSNGALQGRQPDLEVLAHPLALPVLADPCGRQPLHPYRRLFWGWPEPCRAQPLSDGEVFHSRQYTWRVCYTPGHAADHFCLYEPEKGWLFSGDLYVGGKDRALRAGYDIWMIIESLKRVAELPARKLFPGSARMREDPPQAIREKITYLEDLGQQVLALHQRGWTVAQISRKLMGGSTFVEFVTLGHFSRRNLVRSYLRENTDW